MASTDTSAEPGKSSSLNKPEYQTSTTGNYWTDVKEAVKIGEIPCARSSLLSGIASGAGVGVIRGLSAGPLVACNWAVGTFMLISLGTWSACRKSLEDERRRVQQVVEQLPKRFAKKSDESSQDQK
ncbi:hypothetical protein WOLCODRAFT_88353 [Wolfiporia cocos MD-104 SS10]|uniref:Cytochrome c oxidase assembly protein COX20, mitochondrial n=1 Tax=Wolfiporia cocos (strain MD-104) TaxID=742152 RepID=A0A2H3JM76_WOLCO|nr:hypothetical protein WOLCODRAFT_88353 [Wolfiporia cocos MD-104 SS10]